MGVCYSRLEGKEAVSRCKSRKRYVKEFVKSRHFLSASHSSYLRSLRSLSSSLLRFSSDESSLHLPLPRPSLVPVPVPAPSPSPPPPPLSPIAYSWTTTSSSDSQSHSQAMPPPPPPPRSGGWDFWDPFMGRPQSEEEWAPPPVAPTAEPVSKAMVVSRSGNGTGKDLVGIAKELEEYFSRAADAGVLVSVALGDPAPGHGYQDGGTGIARF